VRNPAQTDEQKTKFIYLLLMVYVGIEFIRPQDTLTFLALIRPALIISILLIINWATKFGLTPLRDPLMKYFLAIVVIAAIYVPFANNNFWAFTRTRELANFLLAATIPIAIVLQAEDRRNKFFVYWISIHIYLAFYALTHSGTGPGSFLTDENDLALTLGMCLPYPLYMAQSAGVSSKKKMFFYIAAVIIVAGIVSTNSRGGFVGLASVVCYMLWMSKQRIRNFLVVIIFAFIAFLAVPSQYIEEIQSITEQEDGTRLNRLYLWRVGWTMFADNPVFGVGPGNFSWRVVEYQQQLPDYVPGDQLFGARAAHSLYFTVLPEFGIVGTSIFGLMVFQSFSRMRKIRKAKTGPPSQKPSLEVSIASAVTASLVGYFSAGAFISVLYYPHFWYTIGIVAALSPLDSRTIAETRPR